MAEGKRGIKRTGGGMSFDSIPEDKIESYPCDECGGNVTKDDKGYWSCDNCTFYIESEGLLNE